MAQPAGGVVIGAIAGGARVGQVVAVGEGPGLDEGHACGQCQAGEGSGGNSMDPEGFMVALLMREMTTHCAGLRFGFRQGRPRLPTGVPKRLNDETDKARQRL